jgi:nucleolar protein 53
VAEGTPMSTSRKGRQRSKTKIWRKLDVRTLEELSIQQTQEALRGGPLSARKSEELFFEDRVVTGKQKLSSKDKKIKWKNYVLKIHRSVQPNPYTKAEKVPLQRRKKDISQRMILKLKRKMKRADKRPSDVTKNEQQTAEIRQFEAQFFDLWSESQPSLKMRKRLNPAKFPAVEVADPGASYNPSHEDHQRFLQKVLEEQLKAEEKEKKLRKEMKRPNKRKREEFEASFTIDGVDANENESDNEESSHSSESREHRNQPFSGAKTIAERKKEKRMKRMKLQQEKKQKQKELNKQLERLPEIMKEIETEEQTRSRIKEITRKLREEREKTKPNRLGRHRYEDDPTVYLCTDELPENLLSLTPQSDLLRERFKSFQKRNFIEVTVPVRMRRRIRPKFKLVKKRSFCDSLQP